MLHRWLLHSRLERNSMLECCKSGAACSACWCALLLEDNSVKCITSNVLFGALIGAPCVSRWSRNDVSSRANECTARFQHALGPHLAAIVDRQAAKLVKACWDVRVKRVRRTSCVTIKVCVGGCLPCCTCYVPTSFHCALPKIRCWKALATFAAPHATCAAIAGCIAGSAQALLVPAQRRRTC